MMNMEIQVSTIPYTAFPSLSPARSSSSSSGLSMVLSRLLGCAATTHRGIDGVVEEAYRGPVHLREDRVVAHGDQTVLVFALEREQKYVRWPSDHLRG